MKVFGGFFLSVLCPEFIGEGQGVEESREWFWKGGEFFQAGSEHPARFGIGGEQFFSFLTGKGTVVLGDGGLKLCSDLLCAPLPKKKGNGKEEYE